MSYISLSYSVGKRLDLLFDLFLNGKMELPVFYAIGFKFDDVGFFFPENPCELRWICHVKIRQVEHLGSVFKLPAVSSCKVLFEHLFFFSNGKERENSSTLVVDHN